MYINMERDSFLDAGIAPRQRRVFLLRWNISESPFKSSDFERYFRQYKEMGQIDPYDVFDWNVWEWDKVMHRDLFVMMQSGGTVNGIVCGGFFEGYPYEYENIVRTRDNRHFFELTLMYMQHIEKTGLLTANKLYAEIPEVDWLHGHSGELLSIESAEKLGRLLFNELRKADPESQDFYFDDYNQKRYVLQDILTFMCPSLKRQLLELGKVDDINLTDINKMMVRIMDEDYLEWKNIRDHLELTELNDILI